MYRHSIVEYFDDSSGYKCGYCKNPTSSFSQGMWAHSLNVEDYQELIDRGWRRSGKYCYKPTMKITCCPQYAIRCHANNFKFSKSKKKVAKRMKQFVESGDQSDIDHWKKRCENRPLPAKVAKNDVVMNELSGNEANKLNAVIADTAITTPFEIVSNKQEESSSDGVQKEIAQSSKSTPSSSQSYCKIQKGMGPDPNKPVCRKAKEIRKERKLQKLKERKSASSTSFVAKKAEPLSLKEALPHLIKLQNAKHQLQVKLVRPGAPNQEFEKTKNQSLKLYQKYQCTIHNDLLSDCSENQWTRFLVDSPLNFDPSGPGPGFGTFHNQYWLDDKLMAVGVVDVLPSCVSSVYLYYDPDYGFLSLGVYSALSEIHLVRQLQQQLPSIEYYVMGYYIHSCPKMRYKGAYDPSELLCPETYTWVPISKCLSTLDKQPYARLNVLDGGSPDAVDPDDVMSSIDNVLCLYRRSIATYGAYKKYKYPQQDGKKEENEEIVQYVSLVGETCARRMLLYRSSA